MKTKKFTLHLLALILIVCISTTSTASTLNRYETFFLDVFDTFTQVIVYTEKEETAKEIQQFIHNELLKYHKLYNIYETYEGIANIKTINDQAGISPVVVDKEIINLLDFVINLNEKYNTNVNIAMGSVLSLWHYSRSFANDNPEKASLPSMNKLQEANKYTNIANIIINKDDNSVYLKEKNMSLDVGAVAKGYAVEQIAKSLNLDDDTSVLLSVGGNVRAIGEKENGFVIGVQNPNLTAENQSITRVILQENSFVSSGDYQRFFTVDGKNYHHIIDPTSLMPATHVSSVSVITKDSGLADYLSTVLFILPIDEGLNLVNKIPDTHVLWITSEGTMIRSQDFNLHEKQK